MDNLKGFSGIRRMDRFLNAWIRELCRVKKGLNERIDKVYSSCLSIWKGWKMIGLLKKFVYRGVCW